jgi:hypothetical protein
MVKLGGNATSTLIDGQNKKEPGSAMDISLIITHGALLSVVELG